jgi:hypothetical protein
MLFFIQHGIISRIGRMTKDNKGLVKVALGVIKANKERNNWNRDDPKIKYNDVTIVRNLNEGKTYWTIEIDTHFKKKDAEQFYTYISLYHKYLMTLQK